MARIALQDQHDRTTHVTTAALLEKLRTNLSQHQADYEEAVGSYKQKRKHLLQEAFDAATHKLAKSRKEQLDRLDLLTQEELLEEPDTIMLCRAITLDLQVPRNYAEAYETAIQMLEWETRETVELSMAEFNCFVQDKWEWKNEFTRVMNFYKMK